MKKLSTDRGEEFKPERKIEVYELKPSCPLRFFFLSLIAAAFFSVSCESLPVQEPSIAPVYLDNGAAYRLLSPDSLEKAMDMRQKILGKYGDREFIMDALVIASESGVDMILLNDFGTEMGQMSFDGKRISFDSALLPPGIKGEYIVADFQLVFYKTAELEKALGQAGLSLEIQLFDEKQSGGLSEKRTVKNGNNVILEISKSPAEISYVNHLRKYSYTLQGDFQ
ncbi:MAG: DUF3261 domain-containing protein [Treponema sp.]|nr:DUF3261 domain-containing protein [Treponema sp.]